MLTWYYHNRRQKSFLHFLNSISGVMCRPMRQHVSSNVDRYSRRLFVWPFKR